MLPIIFSVGPFTLYSFGLILFIAFFAFTFVVWKRGRELHFDEEKLFDAVFVILFWYVIGARFGYVMEHWEDFQENLWSVFNLIGRPGMMYYTGLIAASIAAYTKARSNKWDVYSLGDVLAVALSLALSLMAFGMFLNGSGVGVATDLPIGIIFPGMLEKRLPIQLLEVVLYGGLFVMLWWLENRYRTFSWYKGKRSEANSGFLLSVFLIGHGLIGFLVTWLRPASLLLRQIRFDWLYFLVMAILGLILLIRRSDMKLGERFSAGVRRS